MHHTLSLCGQETRNQDHDQFLCALFAPEDKRDGYLALLTLEREVGRIRDLVKEPQLGLIRLQWWIDFVSHAVEGASGGDENGIYKEIGQTISQGGYEKGDFDRFFNARRFDMEDRSFDDLAALKSHCEATSGEMARLRYIYLGGGDAEAVKAAQHLGTALGILQIIRQIPYQARNNRHKVPLSLLKKHEINLKDLFDFKVSEGVQGAVFELVELLRTEIAAARSYKSAILETQLAVFFPTVFMEDYLKRLAKVDFNPFDPNIGGGRLTKQLKLGYYAFRRKY